MTDEGMIDFMQETNNVEFNIEKFSGGDEGNSEIKISPLTGNPIELLEDFIDEKKDDWRYLKRILQSIVELTPDDSRELMKRTFNYILKSNLTSAWIYGGLREIFEIFTPNLSNYERWMFIQTVVESFHNVDETVNLYTPSSSVEDFCATISKDDQLLLKRGYLRLISNARELDQWFW
ncbi:MAG: hypothetical protein IPI12_00545 [Ignavibacteriales bacterium]|nr:hypothetical protein [Ignavibacteriales bacterium]